MRSYLGAITRSIQVVRAGDQERQESCCPHAPDHICLFRGMVPDTRKAISTFERLDPTNCFKCNLGLELTAEILAFFLTHRLLSFLQAASKSLSRNWGPTILPSVPSVMDAIHLHFFSRFSLFTDTSYRFLTPAR